MSSDRPTRPPTPDIADVPIAPEETVIADAARTARPQPHRPAPRHLHVAPPVSATPLLSSREIEVLVAWLRAESKKEAAEALFISTSTVSTHVARIRAKYESAGRRAGSKSALFARAVQDGIVALDDW
ncbi:MAG: helix-turn-helix transcriptional regulator [Gordonia sp. (in: high G+C Gram-positive bacteria)]